MTPRSYLTLSALTDLLPEDAQTAALIEAQLAAIDRVRAAGDVEAAEVLQADLVAFVFAPTAQVPECELRALWGDR